MGSNRRLRSGPPSGIALVGGSTLIAGLIGYLITWLVPRQIGFVGYADFASFWAFVFLLVATLSGIQQEVTRGTTSRSPGEGSNKSIWLFASAASFSTLTLIIGSAPLWVRAVFLRDEWALVWPLAIGAASYIFIAVITGTLYGLAQWRMLFVIVVFEAVLRLVAVAFTARLTPDVTALAWAIVAPFPITAALLLISSRFLLFRGASMDVPLVGLSWNVARTVLASASMGLIISGFPLLLTLTSLDEERGLLALAILVSTLVRAPLIVSAMALQSYLIVLFKSKPERFWLTFALLQALTVSVGGVLAVLGFFLGTPGFRLLFPGEPAPSGWFVAGLILSSACVGALCISAPAVLARSAHFAFTIGWVASALVTTALLLMPVDLQLRTVLALSAGPLVGLSIHCSYLVGQYERHQTGR